MKVTKFYCDCCQNEIEKESEIYKCPTLNIMSYMNDGSIEIKEEDICIDCLYKLTEAYISEIKF